MTDTITVPRAALEPFTSWLALLDRESRASSDGRTMPDSYAACYRGPTMGELRALAAAPVAASPTIGAERADDIEHLRHVIDRDRYAVAEALGAVDKIMRGYSWLREPGRGPYAYDDERYQQEFGDAYSAIQERLEAIRHIAADKSDCTIDPDKVQAARSAGHEKFLAFATPVAGDTEGRGSEQIAESAGYEAGERMWLDVAVTRGGEGLIVNRSAGIAKFVDDGELHFCDTFDDRCEPCHPLAPGLYRWEGFNFLAWGEGDPIFAKGGQWRSLAITPTGHIGGAGGCDNDKPLTVEEVVAFGREMDAEDGGYPAPTEPSAFAGVGREAIARIIAKTCGFAGTTRLAQAAYCADQIIALQGNPAGSSGVRGALR